MRNKSKSILVDDKKYWKKRHSNIGDLRASGVKSASLKSSKYIYKILEEQYSSILDELTDITSIKPSIIDAGFGDGYFLNFFQKKYPKSEIYGVDISEDAKEKVSFKNKENLRVGDLTNFNIDMKFDIVHCFDVLYHILDDEDYSIAIQNLCNTSSNYLILHERFLARTPLYSSSHVRFRERDYTTQLLNRNGFFLYRKKPTHFFAVGVYLYKITSLFPKLFYRIDKMLTRRHPSLQERLATHHIYVFKKITK